MIASHSSMQNVIIVQMFKHNDHRARWAMYPWEFHRVEDEDA